MLSLFSFFLPFFLCFGCYYFFSEALTTVRARQSIHSPPQLQHLADAQTPSEPGVLCEVLWLSTRNKNCLQALSLSALKYTTLKRNIIGGGNYCMCMACPNFVLRIPPEKIYNCAHTIRCSIRGKCPWVQDGSCNFFWTFTSP